MIITKNATQNQNLITGTEILSVNGFSASQIADSLLLLTKGDGLRNAKRFNSLEVSGYDYYEPFDVYFPLFFSPIEGRYTLSVRIPGESEIKTVSVDAVDRKSRYEPLLNAGYNLPSSYEETWKFSKLSENAALLKIGTFAVWDFELDWKKFLKDAFNNLDEKNIPNLVIDIRGNEGGLDAVLKALQKYLVDEGCSYIPFEQKVRYDRVPENLKPYLNTWDNGFYNLSGKINPCGPDFYCMKKNKKNEPVRVKKGNQAYTGKVWFLIDAANSSSTFYLARIAKECGFGTLVGQDTGGTKQGINGGGIFFLRLPNSKIEVDIPIFGSFAPGAPDEGIKPDIPVERTVQDIVEGQDPEMEAVLELIR